MKVGMIQSNYIPWRGYFDFIDDVDCFVFYDDVAFGRGKKWRNRNKVKTGADTKWLTVPLQGREDDTLIQEVRIDYSQKWQKKHLGMLTQNYRQTEFYQDYIDQFTSIIEENTETISALNVSLCSWIMKVLGIDTEIRMSREFEVGDASREERPLLILEQLGATGYIAGPVARPYTDEAAFRSRGIALEYKAYDYAPYPQASDGFIPDVSVLDLMFNTGPEARNHLKSLTPNEQAS